MTLSRPILSEDSLNLLFTSPDDTQPLPSAPPLSDSVPEAKHISHKRSPGPSIPQSSAPEHEYNSHGASSGKMSPKHQWHLYQLIPTGISWYPQHAKPLPNSFQAASQSLEWFFYVLLCPCCAMMSGIPLVCSKIWNNSNCFLLSDALYSVLPLLLR